MIATTVTVSIPHQLLIPDPVSRNAASLRKHLYRISDDPRPNVLAKALEERLLADIALGKATRAHIYQCLTAICANGCPLPYRSAIATAEGIDVADELAARVPYHWQQVLSPGNSQLIILIVGALWSETSHLFNLLAYTRRFAYFTTASSWARPTSNLNHLARHLFATINGAVLAVDNKRTRTIPTLIMPGEAEDIWARAILFYRHLGGHRCKITPIHGGRPAILTAAAHAHTRYFARPVLLGKSLFNSFRTPQTEALWGAAQCGTSTSPGIAHQAPNRCAQPIRVLARQPAAHHRRSLAAVHRVCI
jgi:hypothetical protein